MEAHIEQIHVKIISNPISIDYFIYFFIKPNSKSVSFTCFGAQIIASAPSRLSLCPFSPNFVPRAERKSLGPVEKSPRLVTWLAISMLQPLDMICIFGKYIMNILLGRNRYFSKNLTKILAKLNLDIFKEIELKKMF